MVGQPLWPAILALVLGHAERPRLGGVPFVGIETVAL
jgi:hypothetical protein